MLEKYVVTEKKLLICQRKVCLCCAHVCVEFIYGIKENIPICSFGNTKRIKSKEGLKRKTLFGSLK